MQKNRKPQDFASAQQGPPMIPEFDYRLWVIQHSDYVKGAEELTNYLNSMSLSGWNLQGAPREAFHDDKVVVSTTMARAKERKVLGPVGLA